MDAATLPKRLALLALLIATPLRAEEPPPPNLATGGQAGAEGPVSALSAALRLYARAEAAGDALDMAVAARLAARVDLRTATGWKTATTPLKGGDATVQTPVATLEMLLSGEAMAGALLMAEEDEALSDVLLDLPPPGPRDRIGGVSRSDATLSPATAAHWDIPFPGQSPAGIAVFAAGPGALVWRVEDAGGNPVCPEVSAIAMTACTFVPAGNGFFRVIIGNAGSVPADYVLVTN